MLLAPLLNPDATDNENLREKFKEIPLLDSFKVSCIINLSFLLFIYLFIYLFTKCLLRVAS